MVLSMNDTKIGRFSQRCNARPHFFSSTPRRNASRRGAEGAEMDYSDLSDHSDHSDQSDQSDISDQSDQSDISDKSDQSDQSEKSENSSGIRLYPWIFTKIGDLNVGGVS